MIQVILVGVGAGAAAALLFASVVSGSPFATLLFSLAPLPILIAALGWSHWVALVAILTAATGLAGVLGLFFSIAFLIGAGLPGWWLGYLTLLVRPTATPGQLEWYPIGRLVLWAALIATFHVAVAIPNFGTDQETFQAALRAAFEQAVRLRMPNAAENSDIGRVIDILVAVIPPAAAVLATVTGVVNLWLAGRIAKVSGRLKRPWPDLSALALPGFALALLAGAAVATMLPDLPGLIAGALTASLLMAYALVGLAVMHVITRELNSRPIVLAGMYASVFMFGWPVLAMTLLGLADSVLNIRARRAGRPGPPSIRT
jgi:hypothetical protein